MKKIQLKQVQTKIKIGEKYTKDPKQNKFTKAFKEFVIAYQTLELFRDGILNTQQQVDPKTRRYIEFKIK